MLIDTPRQIPMLPRECERMTGAALRHHLVSGQQQIEVESAGLLLRYGSMTGMPG